jgi:hypothetical protein
MNVTSTNTAAAAPATSLALETELPELKRLESRIMFPATTDTGPMTYVDVVPTWQNDLDPKTPFFSSVQDAVTAAQALATKTNAPIGVIEGTLQVTSNHAPKFFLSALEEVRHGTVRELWVNGGTERQLRGRVTTGKLDGPILPSDRMPTAVDTKDISEIRYVLHNEAVQAIVMPKWHTVREQEDGVRWTSSIDDDPFGF